MPNYDIGGGNNDFADIAAFLAWIGTNYSNDITGTGGITATVYDDETTSGYDLTGITATASDRLIIQADPAHSWKGKWLASNITITHNGSANCWTDCSYLTVRGFQVDQIYSANGAYGVEQTASLYTSTFENMHCRESSSENSNTRVGFYQKGATLLKNCVASGYHWSGGRGFSAYSGCMMAAHCLAYDCTIGYRTIGGGHIHNCMVVNCTTEFYGTLSSDSTNCQYEDAAPPGTGHVNATPVFVDAANLDFHLAASGNSALMDAGDDLTGEYWETLTDCDGDTRSTTPDIGPDEYVASATDSTRYVGNASGELVPVLARRVWVDGTGWVDVS